MSKPKRSPLEGQVGQVSQQERNLATGNQATAQGTYSQFEGPVQNSPFYKALLTAGRDSTSDAYQQAKVNTASRAKAAGFGNQQPIATGAQDQVESQEAKAQAKLPGEALVQATGPALAAAGGTAGIGATQSGAGLGYSGQQVDLEKQYQQQLAAQQQAMWQSLAEVGGDVLGGPIGGELAKKFA